MLQCFVFPFNPTVPLCIFILTVKHKPLFSCQITPGKRTREQRWREKEKMQRGRGCADSRAGETASLRIICCLVFLLGILSANFHFLTVIILSQPTQINCNRRDVVFFFLQVMKLLQFLFLLSFAVRTEKIITAGKKKNGCSDTITSEDWNVPTHTHTHIFHWCLSWIRSSGLHRTVAH